jgi:regulator of replication initiation timing
MLDGMIKELTDMREFLIATVEENRLLRDKVERFKKVLE